MEEKVKLSVLIVEYKITNDRIESFIKTQGAFYWQGLAIVFGLLGIFREYKEVLLALPIVVVIYVGLFLYHYQRCLTNQVYKKRLEDKINQICGEKLLFYTDLAFNKIEESNKFIAFNLLSYSILVIISIIAFITYFTGTTSGVNRYFIVATAIILVTLTLFLILAMVNIPKKLEKINDEYIPEIFREEKKFYPTLGLLRGWQDHWSNGYFIVSS